MSQADEALAAAFGPSAPSSAGSAPTSQADAALAAAFASPAKSRSIGQQANDALVAFNQHLLKPFHGAAQLIENAAAKGASWLPDNPVSRYINDVAQSDNRGAQEGERQYQAQIPDSPGAYVGATVGEIAPFLVGGAATKLQNAGDYVGGKIAGALPAWASKAAPVIAKIGSGAVQGAVVGAAQPVTNAGGPGINDLISGHDSPGYWDQKARDVAGGAAVGGAVPAATSVIGAGWQGVKNIVRPIAAPRSLVAPALKGLAPEGIPAATELVPGSRPTLAQVLANPDAVGAEKVMRNNPQYKPLFEALDNSNNDARIAAVERVAQTPDALAKALQDRTDTTAPMIDKLLNNPKTSQPIKASSVLSAVDQLENSSFSTDPVIKKTLGAVRKQIEEASTKTDLSAYTYTPSQLASIKQDQAYIRPDLLDGIRQNLRNIIRDNSSTGAVSSKQEAGLAPLADRITSEIESVNPGYRDYLATYAKKSQPINTMETARSLLDNVGGLNRAANSSGAPAVTLTRYSSELAKALKNSPYGIEPDAQKTLEAVQADLQRASISNSLRSAGSDTVYNIQAPGWLAKNIYGEGFSGTPSAAKLAGALGGGITGALTGGPFGAGTGAMAGAAAMSKLSGLGQSRVNDLYARALSDPEFAAELAQTAAKVKPGATSSILLKSPQLAALLQQAEKK